MTLNVVNKRGGELNTAILFGSVPSLTDRRAKEEDVELVKDTNFYNTILAVESLARVLLPNMRLVLAGPPRIVSIVLEVAIELGKEKNVYLFQSKFYKKKIGEEMLNLFSKFNVTWTSKVTGDKEASVQLMRDEMFAFSERLDMQPNCSFILGGKKDVIDEAHRYVKAFPKGKVAPIASTGGAARALWKELEPYKLLADKKSLETREDYSDFFSEMLPN